jgi:protease IV
VLENIQKAKVDSRIKGILLHLNNPEIGQGRSDDLRDAIADFKKSGKPVYAYMERGGDREYSLAVAADKIFMSPVGDLAIKGFAAHATFMKGFLDKLKVQPNFARYGKYKSYIERYSREDMSEAEHEELDALLDGFYAHYVELISKSRKKDAETVKKLIDEGPYSSAVKAKEVGLIDDALYLDQVKEQIKQDVKLTSYEGISGYKYTNRPARELGIGKGDKIAVIYLSGGIVSGKSNKNPFSDETAGSDTIAAAIKKAREDSDIKAIILRVDSPGGSALASDIIWREVMLTREAKKPFVACMADVAASGGYYVSMAADKIVAQPGTITGSIGVFGGKFNINGLYHDHLGLNVESLTRGKHADIYSEYKNFSEEELQKITDNMVDFYKTFITKVAEGRKLKVEDVDAIAQGRVWTGTQAKERGLVDEMGGLAKAIEIAKQLAKMPADSSPHLVEFPQSQGFAATLLGDREEDASISEIIKHVIVGRAVKDEMPAEMRETMRTLSLIKQLEHEHVLALPAYQITIR